MTTIWAYSKNAPGKTCEDAKLLGGGTNLQYPAGNEKGQAGWDVGLMFNSLDDLTGKLRVIKQKNQISRLALNLHGTPGKIDADSTGVDENTYDFNKLWSRWDAQLKAINGMLEAGAVVLIMGCNVASGDVGAAFLSDFSKTAFPGHKIVGFTTIGETLGQFRSGGFCTEPGMRDTPYQNSSEGSPTIKAQREKEYLQLPWASESSPHAKVALNGSIIVGAEARNAPQSYAAENYLPGTWSVTIGGWNGYFVFQKDKNVYWRDSNSFSKHFGSWGTSVNGCSWQFKDDAPAFKRLFEVSMLLSTTVTGAVKVNAGNSGFFTMSKQN